MSKLVRNIPFVLFLSILLFACNLPAVAPSGSQPPAAGDAIATSTPTPGSNPIAAEPVQACNPIVTTTTVANVRSGPDIVYGIVGNLPLGATAPVAGKNLDGTWWYIQFPGGNNGYAWIAGLVTTATCIPTTLPVIAAPPPPPVVEPPKPPKPGKPAPTDVPPTSSGPILYFPPVLLYSSPTPIVCFVCKIPLLPASP